MADIPAEIAELLKLLSARDEFDEIARLFQESSRPWQQYSEDERNRLVERAVALMTNRRI